MLGGKRTERVGELLKAELSRLILTKLKDPRIGFVTITEVVMSPDLRYAKVMYSVLHTKTSTDDHTREALESAKGFLQHELADLLKLRLTPRLQFYLDKSAENSLKIDEIIKKIHTEENEEH